MRFLDVNVIGLFFCIKVVLRLYFDVLYCSVVILWGLKYVNIGFGLEVIRFLILLKVLFWVLFY